MKTVQVKYIVSEEKAKKAEMERQIREIWKAMQQMGERERMVLVGIARGMAE